MKYEIVVTYWGTSTSLSITNRGRQYNTRRDTTNATLRRLVQYTIRHGWKTAPRMWGWQSWKP